MSSRKPVPHTGAQAHPGQASTAIPTFLHLPVWSMSSREYRGGMTMLGWGKWVFAAAAPLFLSACLWGPGKFASNLALRKDGSFVLDYRGEILLQLPEDKDETPAPWDPKMARCYTDGRVEPAPPPVVSVPDTGPKTRPCTSTEIAKAKAEHEKQVADRAAQKRKQSEEMAKMFGLLGA